VNPRLLVHLALFAWLTATTAVAAGTVDATQIPDGTYTVTVQRVIDAKHVMVTLDNGTQTTLAAGRDTVDFSKVKQNDQIKLSLIKGSVMVYADLTTH
jgi:hypothetical protein